MSVNTSCYDNVIGLSRIDCECFDTPPVDYDLSLSGLYLDELIDISIVDGLKNCANGGELWTLMEKAREQAIITFASDAKATILKYNQLKRLPFVGNIGRVKTTGTVTLHTGDYAGVRWYCADVVSGEVQIKKIGAIFSQTGTIDLDIYNNLNELVYSVTLDTVANTHTITDVDITLPLHNGYVENLEYFFIYSYTGNLPRNNDLKCDCGRFKAVFDTCKPYFYTQTEKQYGWAKWVMVGAYKTTDITDFSDCMDTACNDLYGLTFPEVHFRCNVDEVFCMDAMDFDGDPLAVTKAFAIRYKAAVLLVDWILRSPNLNRTVMINGEQWQKDKVEFEAKYLEYLNYVVDNTEISLNDCLECKDLIKIGRGTIWT